MHFGGGTPTYLDEQQLRDLMGKLASAFTFDKSATRQFSIEVDPRTVDADGIRLLQELGFNRLSLGVQDFNPDVQEAVNRIQSVEQTEALVSAARESGFKSVSFDLIYGLPLQTVDSFDNTLDVAIGMRPDRFAVYNYAHLPRRFKGQRMIPAEDIPVPETKLEILDRTIERLTAAGYIYIGMDHFALPEDELVTARLNGSLQRNFQGYSTHRYCDLISLGVSSISNIGNVYAQNSITTMEYEALLEDGHLPIRKGLAVDEDDQLRAQVIQELMCYDELVFDEFDSTAGIDFRNYFSDEIENLAPLEKDGLLEVDNDSIRITPRGRLLIRNIAMTFDRYLKDAAEDQRFSRAI